VIPGRTGTDAAAQLRTSFAVDHPQQLERALLYVGSRGYYKCYINNASVSDHEQGHTTTFEVRTLYDTFDVTDLIERQGAAANVLGCVISRGWYGEGGGMGTASDKVYVKSLILKLSLHYQGGTRSTVVTAADGSWSTATGPYLLARIFPGVVYDARRETPGWTSADFTPTSNVPWHPPVEDTTVLPTMQLRSAMTPFIRHTDTFPATNFTTLPADPEQPDPAGGASARYLFDMGQNAAAQISITLPPSSDRPAASEEEALVTLSLAFAESQPGLGQGGVSGGSPIVYHSTAGKIAASGIDWSPHFTYNGFQFCTLTITSNSSDASNAAPWLPVPTIQTLTSHFTHSDVDHGRSEITFNLPLLNIIRKSSSSSPNPHLILT